MKRFARWLYIKTHKQELANVFNLKLKEGNGDVEKYFPQGVLQTLATLNLLRS